MRQPQSSHAANVEARRSANYICIFARSGVQSSHQTRARTEDIEAHPRAARDIHILQMSGGQCRVFVVEDHPATARGLKVFLELAGYSVEIATDKKSALALAAQMHFDVLVCDLSLPDGTGWELMETLRKTNPMRGIAFSAFDEPEHVARSKAAGFDEHVVKGTTPETLLAVIDRVAR
ncbi:MAG TPA: response regulator, partial [Chthoniobacterales bacterium]